STPQTSCPSTPRPATRRAWAPSATTPGGRCAWGGEAERGSNSEMPVAEPKLVPRFKERYLKEICPELVKRFGYSTSMQAPRIQKITLNMGVGDAKQDTSMLEAATEQLAVIAG